MAANEESGPWSLSWSGDRKKKNKKMLVEMILRYDAQCYETKRHIPAGVKALYNPQTRTFWTWESKKYTEFREQMPPHKLK